MVGSEIVNRGDAIALQLEDLPQVALSAGRDVKDSHPGIAPVDGDAGAGGGHAAGCIIITIRIVKDREAINPGMLLIDRCRLKTIAGGVVFVQHGILNSLPDKRVVDVEGAVTVCRPHEVRVKISGVTAPFQCDSRLTLGQDFSHRPRGEHFTPATLAHIEIDVDRRVALAVDLSRIQAIGKFYLKNTGGICRSLQIIIH